MNRQKIKWQKCTRCELWKTRKNVIFGSGKSSAAIVIVGEAPGTDEDKKGIPFCGKCGRLLNDWLERADLSREDCYITNCLACHPPGNRDPEEREIKWCKHRLKKILEIIDPKIVVVVGSFALETILHRSGIVSKHGKVYEINGRKHICCIHPSWFLKNYGKVEEGYELFKKVREILLEKPKRNRAFRRMIWEL